MKRLFGLLPLLVALITACNPMPVELPLADNIPTFIFFYTEG